MQKSTFTKYIHSLNEEELKQELDNLYNKVPEVKHFYVLELGSDSDRKKIYDRIKKDLTSKYATKSYRKPRRPRIQKINTILREVEKHVIYTFELGDIFLFNVECATTFMKKYHFYSEPLHNNILASFEKACLYIRDALMEEAFEERIASVISNTAYYKPLQNQLKQLHDRIIID